MGLVINGLIYFRRLTFWTESSLKPSLLWTTVKLGYNELGYNEHLVTANKCFGSEWPLYYINQPGYNEPLS